MNWMTDAACRDMDPALFYPEFGMNVPGVVYDTCRTCPVRVDCLDYALSHVEVGVWGGLSERQRRRIRGARRRERAA